MCMGISLPIPTEGGLPSFVIANDLSLLFKVDGSFVLRS